jgi:hypothetical protein
VLILHDVGAQNAKKYAELPYAFYGGFGVFVCNFGICGGLPALAL